jgi:ribose-phosphate pyrophosphokinase
MNVIGDVEGRNCIILDDMINTAGTIRHVAEALKERQARRIIACATHGVFSGPAFEKLEEAPIDEVTVTNTIPLRSGNVPAKVRVLDISTLLSKAILNIHHEESVGSLFI